jgi:thioredoxin 1
MVKTNEKFDVTITATDIAVIDFWAPWCGPCRTIGPIIESIDKSNPDVTVKKINVDENQDLAVGFNIRSIPALLFFKNGKVVERLTGVNSKEKIQTIIDKLK